MNWIGAYDPARYVADRSQVGTAIAQSGQAIMKYGPELINAISEAKQRNVSVDRIKEETKKVVNLLKAEGIDWKPEPITRIDDLKEWAENNNASLTQLISTNPKAQAVIDKIGAAMPKLAKTQEYKDAAQTAKTSEYLGGIVKSAEPVTVAGESVPAQAGTIGGKVNPLETSPNVQPTMPNQTEGIAQVQMPTVPQGQRLGASGGLLNVPSFAQEQIQSAQDKAKIETDINNLLPEISEPEYIINPTETVKENAAIAKDLKAKLQAGIITPAQASEIMIAQAAETKKKYDLNIEDIENKIAGKYSALAARDPVFALQEITTDYDVAINDLDTKLKEYKKLNKAIVKGDTEKASEIGRVLDIEPTTSSVNQAIAALEYSKTSLNARKKNALDRITNFKDEALLKIAGENEKLKAKKDLDKSLSERRAQLRDREIRAAKAAYAAKTEGVRKAVTDLAALDRGLRELGAPEGIFSKPDEINAPGIIGFGAKPFRKWLKNDASKLTPAMAALLNSTIKNITGQAMGIKEVERIEQELKMDATSTVADFLNALALKSNEYWQQLKAAEQGLRPEDVEAFNNEGIITSYGVPVSKDLKQRFSLVSGEDGDYYQRKAKAKELYAMYKEDPSDQQLKASVDVALEEFSESELSE